MVHGQLLLFLIWQEKTHAQVLMYIVNITQINHRLIYIIYIRPVLPKLIYLCSA